MVNKLRDQLLSWLIVKATSKVLPHRQKQAFPFTMDELRKLPDGTVGKRMGDYMHSMGFHLLSNYEDHDIRHILLGYSMEAKGEVRMQAFLLGNNSAKAGGFALLLIGLTIFPDWFFVLVRDFLRGRQFVKMKDIPMFPLLTCQLDEARREIIRPLIQFRLQQIHLNSRTNEL